MAHVKLQEWWHAREIPLGETKWPNIKLYFHEDGAAREWTRCVYFIRLAPPYAVVYGDDCQLESPLVYVGSGSIKQRWGAHRVWLKQLGDAIPGGRYEVWVSQPRLQRRLEFYKDIEADIIGEFRRRTGFLPFFNRSTPSTKRQHTYDAGFFDSMFKSDRRYGWAIYPRQGPLSAAYYKAAKEL
jgi:hypothetical protein